MNLWKWWHQEKLIFRNLISGSNLTKNTAMFFFIILSALISQTSYIAAAIFAAIAFIFAEFRHNCDFNEDGYLLRIKEGYETEADYLSAKADYKKDLKKLTKKHIKNVIKFIIPVAIVLAVALIICRFLDDRNLEQYSFIAITVVAIILVVPIFLERTFVDLNDEHGFDFYTVKYIVYYHKTSHAQRLKLKLLMYSSCILVVAGLALSFCLDIFYAAFTIIGCIVHLILKLTETRLSASCPLKEEYDTQPHSTPAPKNNDNGKGKMLYNSDVERLVQKIADRWSYKSDNLIWGKSEKINYKVSVEISAYTIIQYTINGRLDGVCDEDVSSALKFASYKMDDAAIAIKQETERELSKYNLPQSNYMITVYKGEISRR